MLSNSKVTELTDFVVASQEYTRWISGLLYIFCLVSGCSHWANVSKSSSHTYVQILVCCNKCGWLLRLACV